MAARGEERFMSAREFREYAEECLHSARTAKSNKETRTLLQMAEAWLEAADLSEEGPLTAQTAAYTLDRSI